MIYVRIVEGKVTEVTHKHPEDHANREWQSRWDWKDFATVEKLAAELTALTGKLHLGTDATESTSPRYDIIEAPKVGDEVSKGFNGDYYPCGKIIKVSKTFQVTTDTGAKFRRYKNTGGWRQAGRGFWMVSGVRDERNPHF